MRKVKGISMGELKIKAHKVAIGERYHDDSGWKRLVEIDESMTTPCLIEVEGGYMRINIDDVEWLIQALGHAKMKLESDYANP